MSMKFLYLFRPLTFCVTMILTGIAGAQPDVDRSITTPAAPPSMEPAAAAAEGSSDTDTGTETESGSQPIQLALNFDANKLLEEIRVTGTYIKGIQQEDLPTPLQSFNRDALKNIGAFKPADLINSLTINTGSENNTDAFTQNFTSGTSNINLRGLGVASTLVLLNSRRQTYSAFTTNKGENFVDTASLVPMIAVDRVEILKDGAASLYGSDAVGGVVNFMTRDDFEGVELSLDYVTGDYGQQDSTLSAIYGAGNEAINFIAAFSLFDREGLSTADKRLSGPGDDLSDAGFPGSFLVPQRPTFPSLPALQAAQLQGAWTLYFDGVNGNGVADFFEGLSATPPVFSDLNCPAVADSDNTTLPPQTYPLGLCQFDFGSYYSLVPEEERLQFYSHFSTELGDTLKFEAEVAYADNEARRNNSPSFPITSLPGVPAYHPANPFGVDVAFIGRTLGSGSESMISTHTSETMRIMAALEGTIGESWTWSADVSHSNNEFNLTAEDTLATEFQLALAGLGGSNCSGNPADIGNPNAGCYFFNPFAASPPATANANDAAILSYVTGDFDLLAEAELTTYSVVFSGEIFDLQGGPAAIAIGAQYRDETLDYNYDDNANNNNYLFFIGNPDFDTSRDAQAIFSELSMPIIDSFTMQLSVRAEDYGDGVDSTDPKLAALWQITDSLALRASLGSSFRAPSLFQSNGIQTSLQEISTAAGTRFLPVRAQANPNDPLKPEEADTQNIGLTWVSAGESVRFSIDYWDFDYDQVIIQQNPQAVVNAAFAGDSQARSQLVPNSGPLNPLTIERVNVYYDNASSLQTNGVDIRFSKDWETNSIGTFVFAADLTKILTYDLEDPQVGAIDGLGSRNFNNFGTSTPELRGHIRLGWNTQAHNVNFYARHIDSYFDDQNDAPIDSMTSYDVQYRYTFAPAGDADEGISIAVGGINVTDEDPPYVATNGGFDTKVHDPRGRLYYVSFAVPF
jgi:outer membrane receptor protein involved in Fe transport